MNGQNGKASPNQKPRIDPALRRAHNEDESLLADMADNYPRLRRHLLGGTSDSGLWPAGGLRIRRLQRELLVVVSQPGLKLEASYRGRSLFGILETIEQDMDCESTPWVSDWKGQQEERKWLESVYDGS